MTDGRIETERHFEEMIVELSNEEMEHVQGGGLQLAVETVEPTAARPCKDEDDTGCYSLVTLECR